MVDSMTAGANRNPTCYLMVEMMSDIRIGER